MKNKIMEEIYYNYSKSLRKSHLKKNKFLDVINSDNIILALNSVQKEGNIDPLILPIAETNHIYFQIFENKNVLNEYIRINQLDNKLNVMSINKNTFYLLVEELYLNGITSVILNCEINKQCKTILYPIIELMKYDKSLDVKKIYNKENQSIISLLNKVKYGDKSFFYIYRKDLSAQEVCLYIVKQHIFTNRKEKYIKLYTNEDMADNYCKKEGFIKNGEPMNTNIHNSVLFNSILHLSEKIDYVEIYDDEEYYKMPIKNFLELVMGVGFEQIDLSGK